MSSLDSLPADQRAVLQLVLQRGRTYDEIGELLKIERDAVRQRAIAALDSLGPQTGVDPKRRAQISDYLLDQLPSRAASDERDRLAESPSERAWARVVAAELAPVAANPLPEIPVESTRHQVASNGEPAPVPVAQSADATPSRSPSPEEVAAAVGLGGAGAAAAGQAATTGATPEATAGATPEATAGATPEATAGATPEATAGATPEATAGAAPEAAAGGPGGPTTGAPSDGGSDGQGPKRRPSSRVGGAILLGVGLIAAAVVVVIIATSGGSSSKSKTTTTTASTPATTAASTTTPTTASTPQVVRQINLTSPTSTTTKTAGLADVLRQGSTNGIAIVAQNVPPNTKHDAYAVWLYNTPSDAHILGFVNPGVSKNGRLSTAGALPSNAGHYKQLLVTLETQANPKVPGKIILQGPLSLQ